MLKKETLQTAATVAIGFGVAFLIVASSQTFQSCIGEHYHHESSETLPKGITQFLVTLKVGIGCTGEFVHKNAESIVALFTVILGIATWLLWRATKKLVEGADKTAERQLRAYVFVKEIDVVPPASRGGNYVFNVGIQSTGKTPTRNARGNIDVQAFDGDIPKDFNFPDIEPQNVTTLLIGPNHRVASAVEVPSSIIDSVSRGARHLFMWGWIDYNDVFIKTPRHRTEHCFRIQVSARPIHVGGGGGGYDITFHPYERHNAADNECFRPPAPS